jgi:hypothetical protein
MPGIALLLFALLHGKDPAAARSRGSGRAATASDAVTSGHKLIAFG